MQGAMTAPAIGLPLNFTNLPSNGQLYRFESATENVTSTYDVTSHAFTDGRVTSPLEYATAFVSIFAVFVNLCVLLVIFIGPRAFRTPTFFFISSLATADLLTGVTVLFAIFLPISDGVWERIALKGLAVVSFSASVNSLVVVAADRYVKIHDDRRYGRIFTNRTAALLIAITWLIAVGVFLGAPLLGWSCADGRCACAKDGMCHCDPHYCAQSFTPFTLSYIGMGVGYFYVSLLLMLVLYSGLFITVRRRAGSQQKRHGGSVMGSVPNKGPFVMIHRRREIRLAKTLVIVMGVFFVCWLPVTSLFIYDVATTRSDIIRWFDYCLTSAVIHPLANPVIYSMRLPRMWITFKHLAYALWRRTLRKPALPRSQYSLRLSRTPSTRSYVTGVTSQASFRANGKSPASAPAGRKALSMTKQISMVTQFRDGRQQDSSDGSDCAFLPPHGGVAELKRSASARGASPMSRRPARDSSFRGSVVCRNSDRFVVGKRLRSTSSSSVKVKRSISDSVKLYDGRVVPRESVTISTPFNAETKVAWN